MKYKQNEDGDYVCIHCGIIKKRQNTMMYHQRSHENPNLFPCLYCPKGFLNKQALNIHLQAKHLKEKEKIKCPFDCEFTSLTKGNCLIHILRIHFHDEIQSIMDKHDCKKCEKHFDSHTSFLYHCKDCILFDKEEEKEEKTKEKKEFVLQWHQSLVLPQ